LACSSDPAATAKADGFVLKNDFGVSKDAGATESDSDADEPFDAADTGSELDAPDEITAVDATDGEAGLDVVDASDIGDDLAAADAPDAVVAPDTSGPGAVGAVCQDDASCLSGLCLPSGKCSKPCGGDEDCPPGPGWGCSIYEGGEGGGWFCQCTPKGNATEVCDGQDQDCDGVPDNDAWCQKPTDTCVEGVCECKPENLCGEACPDKQTDPLHCGKCSNPCDDGTECVGGKCVCKTGWLPCGGVCTNVQEDVANCGACDAPCSTVNGTPSCAAGKCKIACDSAWGACDANLKNGCETDLMTTITDCGACGHDCTPGGCVAGLCPASEAVPVNPLGGLALDSEALYWALDWGAPDGEIWRMDIAKSKKTKVAGSQDHPGALVIDPTQAWWVAGSGTTIRRALKVGAPSQLVVEGQKGIVDLVVDSGTVYFTAEGGVFSSVGETATTIAALEQSPWRIAMDLKWIYWTDPKAGFVRRVSKTGGQVETIAGGQLEPWDIAADGAAVYWTCRAGGTVMKRDLPVGAPTPLVVAVPGARGLAIDATHVFFSAEAGGLVARVPKGGGDWLALAKEPALVRELAVGNAGLFWIEGPEGATSAHILSTAK